MYNKITLIGRVGADPEKISTSEGRTFSTFNLAYTDQGAGGEKRTTWFNVNVGPFGEKPVEFVKKGDLVGVVGKLHLRTYTGKDGVEKSALQINASEIILLPNNRADRTTAGPEPVGEAPKMSKAVQNSIIAQTTEVNYEFPF